MTKVRKELAQHLTLMTTACTPCKLFDCKGCWRIQTTHDLEADIHRLEHPEQYKHNDKIPF